MSAHKDPSLGFGPDRSESIVVFATDGRKRLTYLMLFRVGLVTLLLCAACAAELATPVDRPLSPILRTLFIIIAAVYALNIGYGILLRRVTALGRFAALQLAVDLLLTTILVHFTGGAESGFVFMYLLVVVGAALLLGRGATTIAAIAVALYVAVALAGWSGLIPGSSERSLPLAALVRLLAINAVAVAATGVLASRLAVELTRAGEHIASQRTRLRDLAALHKDVIRCLTSGLLTVGRDRRIATFNLAAAEITGIEPHQALGRLVDEVIPELGPLLQSIPEQGSLRRGEVQLPHAQGERTLGISLSPLLDSDGLVLGRIVNFQDLTELRHMEGAVVRSERLAAIGRLAAGIAHEIRNPLAAISGSIELLDQTLSGYDAREPHELMAIVLREVERLNALITELLDFARPRSPEPHRFDAAAMMTELLRVFENDRHLAGKSVVLEAEQPVWVEADPGQLRQVVWNLLRNAAEASPPNLAIEVAVTRQGAFAQVVVRDHGAGIPPEQRARIFEPFFSTKKGGTGLGLATVHRIVEEHHGEVTLEMPPDGGTAVRVRLPAAD